MGERQYHRRRCGHRVGRLLFRSSGFARLGHAWSKASRQAWELAVGASALFLLGPARFAFAILFFRIAYCADTAFVFGQLVLQNIMFLSARLFLKCTQAAISMNAIETFVAAFLLSWVAACANFLGNCCYLSAVGGRHIISGCAINLVKCKSM